MKDQLSRISESSETEVYYHDPTYFGDTDSYLAFLLSVCFLRVTEIASMQVMDLICLTSKTQMPIQPKKTWNNHTQSLPDKAKPISSVTAQHICRPKVLD